MKTIMKKLFTLFFLSTLILISCSKEDSNINLSNPLANTTWKVKTYGQLISKDLDGVAKVILFLPCLIIAQGTKIFIS